ncbi:MAG: hypothetical protein EVB11_11380 [Winogradskyella sp.]|nr:MAG: hypothetical protein EVB11_11380 [Winogradskyella sp.]
MRKSITVSIPEPCHEDWNKMTPRDKGRHCSKCSKTVIDFTNQSDEQVFKHLENSDNTCGRFKTNQLQRKIVLERKKENQFRNWVATGLIALFALNSQKALAQKQVPKTVQNDSVNRPEVKGKAAHSILKEKVISGLVTTASDELPLPGVNIIVKGTTRGTVTDFDGKYTLKVNFDETLVFSYIGFKTSEIKITKSSKYDFALIEMEEELSGEIVIVGGAFSYDSEYIEQYLTKEEREARIEKRKKRNAKWRLNNQQKRLKWKAERFAKKLKRKLKRKSKRE